MRTLSITGAVLLFLVIGLGLNTMRQAGHLDVVRETPQQREAQLAPYWQFQRPASPGPHPLAILLSGCDGVRDNMTFWADHFNGLGYATLIVDSHSPRNLDGHELWRLVCAGQALGGSERAGDAAVALAAMDRLDGLTGDVLLFGASHGGWSALELVNLANAGTVPPGLTQWPLPPETILDQISRMVLLYPYCGILNATGSVPWHQAPEGLVILAENDSVISTPDCLTKLGKLQARGDDLDVVVIADADHAFDQQNRSALSRKTFDEGQRQQAVTLVDTFLAAP